MQENTPEFESKPSSSKDMWLFLIVLDIIFLCVFGFFLYKYFSARVFTQAPVAVLDTRVADALPEPAEVEVVAETETAGEPVVLAAEPAPEMVPVEKQLVPQELPVQPVPQAEPVQTSKQSIIIAPVSANSKYRRVTFRWFGEGNQVALVSGFTNRKPQALKKVGDYWETSLTIAPGTYKFLYIVDGKNTTDPYAETKDGRSVLVVK